LYLLVTVVECTNNARKEYSNRKIRLDPFNNKWIQYGKIIIVNALLLNT
jgi:hypothetical protein